MEKLNGINDLVISELEVCTLPYNIESDSNKVWDTIGKLSDKELEDAIEKEYNMEHGKFFKELLLSEQKYRKIALDTFQNEVLSLIFRHPQKLESLFQLEDLVKKYSIDVTTLKMYIKTLISQIPCNLFCVVKKLEKESWENE